MSDDQSRRRPKSNANIGQIYIGFEHLKDVTQKAVEISQRSIGLMHTGRQRRALAVFSKLIVHNMSVILITQKFLDTNKRGLLDHFSMASLVRSSLDAALMTMYISEPSLTLTEWDFRRQLLFLHDVNNRSRFLKPLHAAGVDLPFFKNRDDLRERIRAKILILGTTLRYTPAQIVEYQRGATLFLNGVRGAVREAGWDRDDFESNQSYLSAYVHSHPVNFINFEDQVTFDGATAFQVDFCRSLFETAAGYLQSVVDRMNTFSNPEIGDPIGPLV